MKTLLIITMLVLPLFPSWAGKNLSNKNISQELTINLDPALFSIPLPTPQWNSLVSFPDAELYSIVAHGSDLYAGGAFLNLGNNPNSDYLARWDGCDWFSVTTAINGSIYDLESSGNTLYAAGSFPGYVGKWSNNTWTTLPGLPDYPYDIAVNANGIYVAIYSEQQGEPVIDIYKWNNSIWVAVGNTLILAGYGNFTLGTSANTLYIGGYFVNAGGDPNADYIAKWNGTNWEGLGTGLNGSVRDIVAAGNDLYVTGEFTDAGGNTNADKIARWDGTTWHNLGTAGFGSWDALTAMMVNNDYVYVYVADYNNCNDYFKRYTLQSGSWDFYPPYSPWACWETHSIVEFNDEIYSGINVEMQRWGEPGPVISISGIPAEICEDAAPIALPTTQSGFTGSWSGEGVTNNVFHPAGLFNSVLLQFNPDPGQCVSFVETYIDVYLEYVDLEGIPGLCNNSAPISLTPYQGNANGNWSGQGVTNNIFNPAGLGGNIVVTFTPTPGQCLQATIALITVVPVVTPSISGIPFSICEDQNPISLPTIQNGFTGDWSGQGVSGNTFNPSGLNGNITLTFTPDPGQCALVATTNIIVEPVVEIIIAGVPDSVCQLASPISLSTIQTGIPGLWSGPGVINNVFYPVNLLGNITLTFNPNTGECADPTATSLLVFLQMPVISGIPGEVCEEVPPFALPTQQGNVTGNWSGLGVSNNTFNPNGLSGNITLTFTPIPNECSSTAMTSISVDPLITPGITGVPSMMCALSAPIPLPEIQQNISGNWSGPGVSGNNFDPAGLSGEIMLTFFPETGQCATPATTFIQVENALIPEITGIPSGMCIIAAPVMLPTIQQGVSGDWSGAGVTNNTFNPNGLNGDILLTFEPDAGQCALTAFAIITVYTSITPSITGVPAIVCNNAIAQNLPVVQSGVIGNWTGQGVTNNIFNPAGLNECVILTFTPNPLQCATEVFWTIDIDSPEVVMLLNVPTALCQSDFPFPLTTTQNGISGTWSGEGIANDTFTPSGLHGSIALTFTPGVNECALPSSTELQVNQHVHPTLTGVPDALCQSDQPIYLLPTQDGITGKWEGPGVVNDTLDPTALEGMITINFVANNGPCEDTATAQVIIHAAPSIQNLQVTCDSVRNTYTVSYNVVGGDSTSYTVDGVAIGGTHFESFPFSYDQSNYSFLLDDANGCGPVVVSGINTCLCTTNAGTMANEEEPLRICRGPKFVVAHNGDAHLDPDDVLGFVLHDQSGNPLGNIYAVNTQGVFSFLPGMVTGQIYYISIVAGSHDGGGGIDFSDPCLSVSPGRPVIFVDCDPEDQNIEPTAIDKTPFTNEEESIDLRSTWSDLLNSDYRVKSFRWSMIDIWGREWFGSNEKTIASYKEANDMFLTKGNFLPGIYWYRLEIQDEDGIRHYHTSRVVIVE